MIGQAGNCGRRIWTKARETRLLGYTQRLRTSVFGIDIADSWSGFNRSGVVPTINTFIGIFAGVKRGTKICRDQPMHYKNWLNSIILMVTIFLSISFGEPLLLDAKKE